MDDLSPYIHSTPHGDIAFDEDQRPVLVTKPDDPDGDDVTAKINCILAEQQERHAAASELADLIDAESNRRAGEALAHVLRCLEGTPAAAALLIAVAGSSEPLAVTASRLGISKQALHQTVGRIKKRLSKTPR